MKPAAAIREYHYWSERLVAKLWQDNVSQLPNRINVSAAISNFGLQVQRQDPPQTRAARAVDVEALLADQLVTDLDYAGPTPLYLAGRSQMVLSSLRGAGPYWRSVRAGRDVGGHEDTGAVTLFADLPSRQGRRIAVCLFGSASNVCGWDPTVPALRQFGWTSSSNKGVEFLLNAANAESAKDPQVYWNQAPEEVHTNVREICRNALTICYSQGERGLDSPPWRRGYTIGHYQDVEWLAQIYFTDRDIIGPVPFDVVHVGAAFWVRSGSARAWVPYDRENIRMLCEAERSPRRSLARMWYGRRRQDRGQGRHAADA